MLHALAFSLLLGAAAPSNQAALATKLAEAIANEHGFTSAKVYVGALPPGKAVSAPLPTAFTLLGSVVQTAPAGGGQLAQWAALATPSTTLFYELPADSQSAMDAYKRRIAQAGFHENAFMQRFASLAEPKGGFATSVVPNAMIPQGYCNGGNTAMLEVQRLNG